MIPVDLISILIGMTIGVVTTLIVVKAGGFKAATKKYFDI